MHQIVLVKKSRDTHHMRLQGLLGKFWLQLNSLLNNRKMTDRHSPVPPLINEQEELGLNIMNETWWALMILLKSAWGQGKIRLPLIESAQGNPNRIHSLRK
jgi:hypothetical protein